MPSKKYDSNFGAFPSKSDEEAKITDQNRLCEKIFQKRAEKNNEGALPDNFWNMPKYKGSYTGEVVAVSRLMKKYSMLAISRAIDSPEAKYVLSYRNKKLIPIIEKYQKQIDEEEKTTEFVESKKEDIKETRKPLGKKNLWSQLE